MFDDTGKANWRHRLTTERLAHIAHELFIVHPDLRIVYSKISHLNRRCVIEGKGKGMLIIANSGMGKSRLAKLFLQRNEADHSGTVSRVPVVVFSSPVDPSRKQLGIALLAALGDPVPKKSDAEELFRRAIKLIKKIETKIIFIDNVQDVPDRRGTNVVMGIGNWIRDLIEQSQCLVVLLGTPAAKEIVRVNSQLQRRVITELPLRMFEVETPAGKQLFRIFIKKLDELLPVADMSFVDDPELPDLICYATHGILDYIIELVTEAMLAARARESERISRDDLALAFEKRHGRHHANVNPFLIGGPKRRLDQFGEPFYAFFDSANPIAYEPKTIKHRVSRGSIK